MATEGSTKAVVAALLANVGIAVAKFTAFLLTRSGSMLAEAAHSLADSGNQGLLLLGSARAKRAADSNHPFGYARESYFFAFVVAVVLFTAGSGFAFFEGIDKLRHPHELSSPAIAIGVLCVGIVLEAFSFRTAARAAAALRGRTGWWTWIRANKTAELTVVLLEDAAALIGLVLALTGVGVATLTHDAIWDAYGTLAIAVLLGVIAIVLAIETKSLLIGEAASPEEEIAIRAALEDTPGIEAVIHLRTEHRGPSELLVAAKVAVAPTLVAAAISHTIDAAERRIRTAAPHARYIFIEPDLARGRAQS